MQTAELISAQRPLSFETRVERHHPNLPRFIVLAIDPIRQWGVNGTFVAQAEFNGKSIGRRSVKPWGDGRWFMDVTQKHCEDLGLDTGAAVHVTLHFIADPTPDDLAAIFAANARLEANWGRFSESRRRQLSEWVQDAKQPAMRQRRVDEIVAMLRRPSYV